MAERRIDLGRIVRRPGRKAPPARRRGETSQAIRESGASLASSELRQRRDELAREFAGLQWDLGGIAYEMASREHFRLDVLTRHAARLQQVDSELGQAERMLAMEAQGAAGACPSCGGLQARGAVYCWQCGKEMTPAAGPAGNARAAGSTATASLGAKAASAGGGPG